MVGGGTVLPGRVRDEASDFLSWFSGQAGLHAFFYKNNFIRTTRLKFAQKLRTS